MFLDAVHATKKEPSVSYRRVLTEGRGNRGCRGCRGIGAEGDESVLIWYVFILVDDDESIMRDT